MRTPDKIRYTQVIFLIIDHYFEDNYIEILNS